SRRRHTRSTRDWSSDVCSSDLGAGAGMAHPFMAAVASELAQRDIATLRYQFPYMERRGKRPDPPSVAHATIRAAVAEARRLLPEIGRASCRERGQVTGGAVTDR